MLKIEDTTIVIPTYLRGEDDSYPPLTFGIDGRSRRRRPFPYYMQDDIDIASMPFAPETQHRVVRMSNGLLGDWADGCATIRSLQWFIFMVPVKWARKRLCPGEMSDTLQENVSAVADNGDPLARAIQKGMMDLF